MLPVSACSWCCERGSGVTRSNFVLFSVSHFAAGRLLASGNTGSSKRQSLFLAFWAHVFPSLCICVAERCRQVLVTWSDIYCYACASGSILPWRHQSRHFYWPQTHSMSCSSYTHSLWVSFALVIQQDWVFFSPELSLWLCIKVNLNSKRNYLLWKRGKGNPTQNKTLLSHKRVEGIHKSPGIGLQGLEAMSLFNQLPCGDSQLKLSIQGSVPLSTTQATSPVQI